MKQTLGALVAAVLVGLMPVVAKEPPKNPAVQLTVDLTDGSRLIGVTKVTSLPVRSEALGKMEIPLAKIRTIKFSRDHESVAVTMTNGDTVKGALSELTLKLQTAFGTVTVPVEHTITISVSVPVTDRERFSAAGDFSAEANPHGPWSYGWCTKDGNPALHGEETTLPSAQCPHMDR